MGPIKSDWHPTYIKEGSTNVKPKHTSRELRSPLDELSSSTLMFRMSSISSNKGKSLRINNTLEENLPQYLSLQGLVVHCCPEQGFEENTLSARLHATVFFSERDLRCRGRGKVLVVFAICSCTVVVGEDRPTVIGFYAKVTSAPCALGRLQR